MSADGTNVLVIGGGPAGWAAAAACGQAGLDVRLVTADPAAGWRQTYGAWLDELAASGFDDATGHRWAQVLVRTAGVAYRRLGRTYCLIDNDALRAALMTRAATADVVAGRVVALNDRGQHVAVATSDGRHWWASAVIDATGYPSVSGGRRGGPLAYQTAFGIIATFDRPPLPAGAMCLMDFDATPFDGEEPATFLYAMDLGGGRWFVEETCLARRPGLGMDTLRDRLLRRLASRGATPGNILSTERVAFPMDAPLPQRGLAVAFGAAAAMVHPATGYHVAHALQRAPHLASAIRRLLAAGATPAEVAQAGHAAVWPARQRRQHALYRLGLEVLLTLDVPATQQFFHAFFDLPPDHWQRYVSRTASPLELQATMAHLLRRLPRGVRRNVIAATVTRSSRRWLAQALRAPAVSRR